MTTAADSRAAAAEALSMVIQEGRYLDAALEERCALRRLTGGARGAAQDFAYGTARFYLSLDKIVSRLLSKPLRAKDFPVHALMCVGIYQLLHSDAPPHAAVNETAAAAALLGRPWATGVVNACLRRFQREGADITFGGDESPRRAGQSPTRGSPLWSALAHDEEFATNHPKWLLARIREAWPEHAEAIWRANNEKPPFWLRVNRLKTTPDEYLALLSASRLAATVAPFPDHAVRLSQPVPLSRLPGFAEGLVTVQDRAAQIAGALLIGIGGDESPRRILDACAAPGGKTSDLLERAPDAEVVALDVDEQRLARVRSNLDRLGLLFRGEESPRRAGQSPTRGSPLRATLKVADAAEVSSWWDGRPFDRILVDAPCSATGILRRRPDIKLRRRPEHLDALVAKQAGLLEALWPCLAPCGRLLYASCSILPEENERALLDFIERHPDSRDVTPALPVGTRRVAGLQILTGDGDMDGFYYALLEKSG